MKSLENVLGFDSSEAAKFKFHVLEVFYQNGWGGVTVAFPLLSRVTLYRWKRAYEQAGKRFSSLLPHSTRSKRVRIMQTPPSLLTLIRSLREKYPRMGKAKIKDFVDSFAKQEGLSTISESVIGKVIKRNHLFFAGKRNGRRSASKERLKFCPKASNTEPWYLQLDGLKFYYLGRFYYFLTGVEIVSKQAWVKLVPRLNSKYGSEFLEEMLQTSWFKIHTIQTDNGSEFKLYFDLLVNQEGLTRLLSYPHSPKTNGYVERFNWTVQDEFLFNTEDYLLYPLEFLEKLTDWLVWYNQERPHQSLGYQSPYQYSKKEVVS